MMYLRQALRALAHTRAHTFINIIGLVVSLTGAIIIARYVHQELTVDRYIPELDRTFFLLDNDIPDDGINWNNCEGFPDVTADKAMERFARFHKLQNPCIRTDSVRMQVRMIAADSLFLEIMPRKVVLGKGNISDSHDAIVTREMAEKLWPGEHPLGKKMKINTFEDEVKVVGVVERPTTKATNDFDVLISSGFRQFMDRRNMVCQLKEGEDYRDVNSRLKPFEEAYFRGYSYTHRFRFVPVSRLYFDDSVFRNYGDQYLPLGNQRNIQVLLFVAALLVAVGLFNFLNIYAVVMAHRRRNFAVRKTFGAGWRQIFCHILTENIILSAGTLAASWLIIAAISPLLQRLYNITQLPSPAFDLALSAAVCILFPLIVSLVTTASLWRTARIHSMDNADSSNTVRLRRYALLLPQMSVTLILIIVSSYVTMQIRYMLNSDMGFQNHDITAFCMSAAPSGAENVAMTSEEWGKQAAINVHLGEIVKEALQKIQQSPLFEAATGVEVECPPTLMTNSTNFFEDFKIRRAGPEGSSTFVQSDLLYFSAGMMKVFNLEVIEGRPFDDASDNDYDFKAIITESTKKKLGITDITKQKIQPSQSIFYSSDVNMPQNPPFTIVGVVRDFKQRHLSAPDRPMFICYLGDSDVIGKILVRYRPEKRSEVLAFLRKLYRKANGGGEPLFEHVEQEIEKVYEEDSRTARVYASFAFLAVVISCMGLFGVVLYDLRRRERELNIRKVCGAGYRNLLTLIARPYALIIVLATIIAVPVSTLLIRNYQADYAHHIALSPWYFLAAILIISALSFVTIASQVNKIMK